jgi:PAS domain S-box-containing protein
LAYENKSFWKRSVTMWRGLNTFRLPWRKSGKITQQFLIDSGIILAASLDYQTTLNSVAQLAISTAADWCAIDLVDDKGAIQRVAVAHRDPDKAKLAQELQQRYPALYNGSGHTIERVLNTRKSWFDPVVSPGRLQAEARDDDHWRLLRELGFTSEMVVPLIAREKTLGTLTLVLSDSQHYTRDDLALAEELARRVALAIENAQLYQEAETQRERFESMMTRYRDLVENANDIIYTLDMDGTLTSVNQAGEEILGYRDDELLGTSIDRIILPEYVERTFQMLQHKMEGGGRTRYEVEVTAKDGRILTLEVNSQLITQGSTPIGIQGIARDITERKEAEKRAEQLQTMTTALYAAEQQARLKAEQADRLKLQFLAMISHELRTPLTSIKGFASTLLATDVEWDKGSQEEFLHIIDHEADKLTQMVDELLDLSRLQVGTLSISPEAQPFSHILDFARPEIVSLAANHDLHINLPDGLPSISADPRRIAQVLTNLVSNAAKYSPPGTRITLTVCQRENMLQVDVSDQGIGILPEHRPLVFEAFQQVERKVDSPIKGAGLGLAICKGLVEAHGGRIWIGDQEPPGTVFTFTLPLATSSPTAEG